MHKRRIEPAVINRTPWKTEKKFPQVVKDLWRKFVNNAERWKIGKREKRKCNKMKKKEVNITSRQKWRKMQKEGFSSLRNAKPSPGRRWLAHKGETDVGGEQLET